MNIDFDQVRDRIAALPLDGIRLTAARKHQWPEEKARTVERTYRQFFGLAGHLHRPIVPPSKDVDLMWHEHILFTKDYMAACDLIHGRFVHHSPMMDLTQDQKVVAVADTVAAFRRFFGEVPPTDLTASCCQGRAGEKDCCASGGAALSSAG